MCEDPEVAELSEADRRMVDFSLKLTRSPESMAVTDVDELRSAGFDDSAILDVVQVVSYYNYVNRMTNGLGVELESYWRGD